MNNLIWYETELRKLIRREGWDVKCGNLVYNGKPHIYVGLMGPDNRYIPVDKVPITNSISCELKTKIMLIAG